MTATLAIYTFCGACPAFLQLETWNVLSAWVELEIDLVAGRVTDVRRISETTAEWIASERAAGSIGPMSLHEASAESEARRRAAP